MFNEISPNIPINTIGPRYHEYGIFFNLLIENDFAAIFKHQTHCAWRKESDAVEHFLQDNLWAVTDKSLVKFWLTESLLSVCHANIDTLIQEIPPSPSQLEPEPHASRKLQENCGMSLNSSASLGGWHQVLSATGHQHDLFS